MSYRTERRHRDLDGTIDGSTWGLGKEFTVLNRDGTRGCECRGDEEG